jgi:hypothetical protein
VLTEIVRIVLPAVYDHGVVETVRNACGEVAAELLTLPACYPTVAEIIMAGADRRAAECGFDSDGEEVQRALDEHLTGKFCWSDPDRVAELSTAVDSFMIHRFPGQSRPGVARSPQRRIKDAAREIACQAETLGRTYYLLLPAPADPDDKVASATNLAAIRERYKGLMCLSLQADEDAEDAEFRCFRPVLELLPKKGTQPP